MLTSMRKLFKGKGQGIVEYALLLAFVVGIAVWALGSDAGLGDAIKIYGKKMSVDELLMILLEDRTFYETSGGGVTLSGGECLCQAVHDPGILYLQD